MITITSISYTSNTNQYIFSYTFTSDQSDIVNVDVVREDNDTVLNTTPSTYLVSMGSTISGSTVVPSSALPPDPITYSIYIRVTPAYGDPVDSVFLEITIPPG